MNVTVLTRDNRLVEYPLHQFAMVGEECVLTHNALGYSVVHTTEEVFLFSVMGDPAEAAPEQATIFLWLTLQAHLNPYYGVPSIYSPHVLAVTYNSEENTFTFHTEPYIL